MEHIVTCKPYFLQFYIILSIFSEVVLGEHKVGRDPDCTGFGNRKRCAPKKITRKVTKIAVHPRYKVMSNEVHRCDIALLRLDEAVPLFNDNPKFSFASPVCLPW